MRWYYPLVTIGTRPCCALVSERVTDALLFLHVLAAFLLMATAVMLSGVALGTPAPARTVTVANVLWDVGGLGTLVLGIYLAIDIDEYEIFDAWIIGAIVLWAILYELGRRARAELLPWHWLRTAVVVLLLVDMIWKPGA